MSVLVTLATLIFSPSVASIVGPYVVIWIGSTLGAYYALGASEATDRRSGIRFFMACNASAMLVTVLLAAIAKSYLPEGTDEKWLFGPIAFLIGINGHRIPTLGRALVTWLQVRVTGNGGKDRT